MQTTHRHSQRPAQDVVDPQVRHDRDVKSYRSRTLQGALLLVRQELGPDASVLETREVRDGVLGQPEFEVLASDRIVVPSRFSGVLTSNTRQDAVQETIETVIPTFAVPPVHGENLRARLRNGLRESSEGWESPLTDGEHDEVDALSEPVFECELICEPDDESEYHSKCDSRSELECDTAIASSHESDGEQNQGSYEREGPSAIRVADGSEDSNALPSRINEIARAAFSSCAVTPAIVKASTEDPSPMGHRRSSEFARLPILGSALVELTTANMDAATACEFLRRVHADIEREGCLDELHSQPAIRGRLLSMIEQELSVRGPLDIVPGQQRVVALVGPTGMGKTTTVAKLAAYFQLLGGCRVGLITVDTYRVAAVDQLRTYARIMELPLVVATNPAEMPDAIDQLSDCDLVLIDTAGCSPHDEPRVAQLEQFLAAANADDVQLVVSATLSPAAMQSTTDRFARSGATAMILTKLDEATGLGDLVRASREAHLPFTYVTNGQEVPSDFAAADASQLAKRVMGVRHSGEHDDTLDHSEGETDE